MLEMKTGCPNPVQTSSRLTRLFQIENTKGHTTVYKILQETIKIQLLAICS